MTPTDRNAPGNADLPPLLVNATDAAAMLAISPRKLWELTNRKLIPHVRIGRAVRYAVNDLEAWIRAQKVSK